MDSYENNLKNRIKKDGKFEWETDLLHVKLEVDGKTWNIYATPTEDNKANIFVDQTIEVVNSDDEVDNLVSRFDLTEESEITGKTVAAKTPKTSPSDKVVTMVAPDDSDAAKTPEPKAEPEVKAPK